MIEMIPYSSVLAGAALAISAVLVPAMAPSARRLGLVDNPCHRKRHRGEIPLTGGLAVFIAFLVVTMASAGHTGIYWSLVGGMAVLLATGMVDDLVDVRAMVKLLIQIAVATGTVLLTGLEIQHLGQLFGPQAGLIGLGPFSTPLTIACIVFMVNVFNMSDGADGLAGGLGVVMLSMLTLIGWLGGATQALTTMSLILTMATAGFLLWNMRFPFRKQAAVFMGDAGSMMLGFAIAWIAVAMTTERGTSVYPITIAWVLLIPCIDTIAVSIRRLSQGRNPMSADRTHMHHILQRCHLPVSGTVMVIHMMTLAAGLFGILAWQFGWPQPLLFALATLMMIGYTTMLLSAHKAIRWSGRRRRMR